MCRVGGGVLLVIAAGGRVTLMPIFTRTPSTENGWAKGIECSLRPEGICLLCVFFPSSQCRKRRGRAWHLCSLGSSCSLGNHKMGVYGLCGNATTHTHNVIHRFINIRTRRKATNCSTLSFERNKKSTILKRKKLNFFSFFSVVRVPLLHSKL